MNSFEMHILAFAKQQSTFLRYANEIQFENNWKGEEKLAPTKRMADDKKWSFD